MEITSQVVLVVLFNPPNPSTQALSGNLGTLAGLEGRLVVAHPSATRIT